MVKFNVDIELIFIFIDYYYFNYYVDVLRIFKEISCIDKLIKLINYLNLDK